jgi:hypothetical protein
MRSTAAILPRLPGQPESQAFSHGIVTFRVTVRGRPGRRPAGAREGLRLPSANAWAVPRHTGSQAGLLVSGRGRARVTVSHGHRPGWHGAQAPRRGHCQGQPEGPGRRDKGLRASGPPEAPQS